MRDGEYKGEGRDYEELGAAQQVVLWTSLAAAAGIMSVALLNDPAAGTSSTVSSVEVAPATADWRVATVARAPIPIRGAQGAAGQSPGPVAAEGATAESTGGGAGGDVAEAPPGRGTSGPSNRPEGAVPGGEPTPTPTQARGARPSPATVDADRAGALPGAHRGRFAEANVAARELSAAVAKEEVQRLALLTPQSESVDGALVPEADDSHALRRADPGGGSAPGPSTGAADDAQDPSTPRVAGAEDLNLRTRKLLFVWDSSVVLSATDRSELLLFAARHGYDSLAMEATGVGYGDAALTAGFDAFSSEADAEGMEVLALIGYPWFAVAADAGLPGQPTSSLEGLAIVEVIRDSGLFAGVVDDSHSYGVTYEDAGQPRNYLFDEPLAASLDMQNWLRDAKALLGDMPLLKTTPFWFDSHPELSSVVDLDGRSHVSLGHLVAAEVDAMVVLAYRDELAGPNGLLELASGELTMGPAIIALETSDLGADLGYLTFFEEGLLPLEGMLDDVEDALGGTWSFAGLGVHHYDPLKDAADALAEVQGFGFVGAESIVAEYGSLVDAYRSSLGRYYDQMAYAPEIGDVAGVGLGALVSNGTIFLDSGARIFGDVRAGVGESVKESGTSVITGDSISLSDPTAVPTVEPVEPDSNQTVSVSSGRSSTLTGDVSTKRLQIKRSGVLYLVGPAQITVDSVNLSDDAVIYADVSAGPIVMTINDELTMGDGSWIAPMSLQAKDMEIRYAGAGSIILREDARILADLVAPAAELVLEENAEIYGRAFARTIEIGGGAELHLDLDLR